MPKTKKNFVEKKSKWTYTEKIGLSAHKLVEFVGAGAIFLCGRPKAVCKSVISRGFEVEKQDYLVYAHGIGIEAKFSYTCHITLLTKQVYYYRLRVRIGLF